MLYLGAKKSLLSAGKTLAQQIAALFAGGEQGAWYDPSDLATLFSDSAGTTPAVVGGPVGLSLDKRLGLVLGPEMVTNTGPFSLAGAASQVVGPSVSAGKTYCVSFAVSGYSGTGDAGFNGAIFPASASTRISGNGVVSGVTTATSTNTLSMFTRATNGATFSAISVRELPGNPAVQATTTARPLNQAAPARLVFDAVDDQHVTTFPSALGSNCTIVRSVPGVGASILTGQTIGTTYANTATHSGLLIINRALTAGETASAARWANQRAFA